MATAPTKRRRPAPAPLPVSGPADRFSFRMPANASTLAGFRAWATSPDFPEHVRAAFLDGEVYIDMSNEEWEAHIAVKSEVYTVVGALVRDEKLGKFYPDGGLITNEDAGVSNNPDACFLSRSSLRSKRARFVPREGQPGRYWELQGTPDWVLEVVSDSSVQKDTDKLRHAYHVAGIPEYWLVDARGEEIDFRILLWRKNGYVAAPVKGGWQRSKVFRRDFRFTRRKDEFDLWEYTLELRGG